MSAPQEEFDQQAFLDHEREVQDHAAKRHLVRGLGMAAVTLVLAGGVVAGLDHPSTHLGHEFPFVPVAQSIIENVDDGFAVAGAVGLPLAAAVITAIKIGGVRNKKLEALDEYSDHEPTIITTPTNSKLKQMVRNVPALAAVGVGLTTLTAGVSAEVGNGPARPIDAMFNDLVPGQPIVQYKQAMPMVESNISQALTAKIMLRAAEGGVKAHVLDLNLGSLGYGDRNFTDLSVGVDLPATSPASWSPSEGCRQVPIMIDEAAGIPVGAIVEVDGITAKNVATTSGDSAMNRIGVTMDDGALNTCLRQDPEAPHHAITLETTPEKAKQILADAEQGLNVPAVVDSVQDYKAQSREFWNANVKPITSLQELVAVAMVMISLRSKMGERLLRNRGQWADKLANGTTRNQLRATELLRSAKDGVKASMIGVAGGTVATMAASVLESGFQPNVGAREAFIGVGVGVVGTVLGGASKLLRGLRQTVNVKEHTRL